MTEKQKFAYVTLHLQDGQIIDIPLMSKTTKNGKVGFYARMSAQYEGKRFSGQVMLWPRNETNEPADTSSGTDLNSQ